MPTSNFGLPLYGPTDTAALDTLLNGQSSAIDSALTSSIWNFGGTDAQRTALTGSKLREGVRWRTTDTDRDWYYDGTNWISSDGGMYLIQPTSVSGTGVTMSGGKVSVGTGSSVKVNGVFTSRFNRYKVIAEWQHNTGLTAVGTRFNFTTTGTVYSSTNYHQDNIYAQSNTAVGSQVIGNTFFSAVGVASYDYLVDMLIVNPFDSSKYTKVLNTWAATNSGYGVGTLGGLLGAYVGFDGFQLECAGTQNYVSGEIAVYGLA